MSLSYQRDTVRSNNFIATPRSSGDRILAEFSNLVVVPYSKNPDFVGRNDILDDLKRGLDHRSLSTQGKGKANARPRLCLYGLGGVGYVLQRCRAVMAFC